MRIHASGVVSAPRVISRPTEGNYRELRLYPRKIERWG